jgi:hypothetical protein
MVVTARSVIMCLFFTSGRLDGFSRACSSATHQVGRKWLGIFRLRWRDIFRAMIVFCAGSVVLMTARIARSMLMAHSLSLFFRSVIVFCSSVVVLVSRGTARPVLMAHCLVPCLGFAHVPGCAGGANHVCSD